MSGPVGTKVMKYIAHWPDNMVTFARRMIRPIPIHWAAK